MKFLNVRSVGVLAMAVLMVGAASGCKSSEPLVFNPGSGADSRAGASGNERTTGEGLPEIDSDWIWQKDRGLQAIYFDYNSYALRADALETLRQNADKIKQVPSEVIQIEGHCDERGTQEYNLALGEKRALATREHLMNLGVSGDRIITISYGEETPISMGHDEAAWSRNRRSEFNRAM